MLITIPPFSLRKHHLKCSCLQNCKVDVLDINARIKIKYLYFSVLR